MADEVPLEFGRNLYLGADYYCIYFSGECQVHVASNLNTFIYV